MARAEQTPVIEASCHCGVVRLAVARPPPALTSCNCSLCRRYGGLWAYYPPSEVEFLAGREATVAYVQGDRTLATHHCRTCGCVTHWEPLDPGIGRMGVNARLMAPEVTADIRIRRFDGAETFTFLD
ncbi:MAG: GFA family protein [Phenylobacterium sp.]|uniref:GFA family protein n=1 Tax=Phenylobacterium sp. TaxID=1871053 RepID=UPI0039197D4A